MTENIEILISSLPGWCSIQKANTLYELTKLSKAKVAVEIGTFGGRAALALASGCKETKGHYYGIDPYHPEPCLEGSGNRDNDEYWLTMDFDAVEIKANAVIEEAELSNFVSIIKKRSQDAVDIFRSEGAILPIDIIYIDGNFTPEVTMEDVENYGPIVRQDGFLVLNNSDWGTKIKAKKRILELGFIEYLKEKDSDGCEWIVYQKTDHKVTVAPSHPIEEVVPTLEGWSSTKQCMALYNLVKDSNAKVSVDLGVFGGRSLFAMALAHKEKGSGVCYGVDPWSVEACLEGESPEGNSEWWSKVDFPTIYRGVVNMIMKEGLTEHANILRFKSEEVFNLFSKIDVCFIDGNHSELLSTRDVSLYAPLVVEGGYIMFDDCSWPTTQAAQDLILNYGFEEIMNVDEGEGKHWKVYRKLGGEPKLDVAPILNEAKIEDKPYITILNPKKMDDKQEQVGIVVDATKRFPIYDPSLKPPCHPIPETPFDIALRGGMQVGSWKLQPMLLYLPDNDYWADRWKRGVAHFKEHGIENLIEVAGVHGKLWGVEGAHTYDRDNPGEGYKIGQGYAAGVISAYIMYSVANVLPFEHFLFLECDAELIPDFKHHLAREIENVPKDADFVFVGSCCAVGKTSKHVAGNVYKFDDQTGYPMCSQTLIIAKKALPYIIQTQRDTYASADINLIFHTFPALNVYGIVPRLSTQYNNELPA